jgi:hypothetical protein
MKINKILSRLKAGFILPALALMLGSCGGPSITVTDTWISGTDICFLINVSGLPAGGQKRISIFVT